MDGELSLTSDQRRNSLRIRLASRLINQVSIELGIFLRLLAETNDEERQTKNLQRPSEDSGRDDDQSYFEWLGEEDRRDETSENRDEPLARLVFAEFEPTSDDEEDRGAHQSTGDEIEKNVQRSRR